MVVNCVFFWGGGGEGGGGGCGFWFLGFRVFRL